PVAAALRRGRVAHELPRLCGPGLPGARRRRRVRCRQALRPQRRPGGAGRPGEAGLRPARGAALARRRDAALAAAAVGQRPGRQPDGLLRRALRRARDGRPVARAGALRAVHREIAGLRRIALADLNASAEELTNLRAMLAGGGVAAIPTETFYGLATNPKSEG